ncbi:hypothetical protein FRC01_000769 [Tulasnella sp. 417]|nr:hypothetical protein FRC01_000769 [Tulasnella sp. 417]
MALVLRPLFPEDLQGLRPEHGQEAAAPDDQQAPAPWESIAHPGGATYYYNPQDRVFTWTKPQDPANAATLENATQHLRQQLTPELFPNEVIIVFGFNNEMRERNIVGYYLICNGFDYDRFESLLLPQYWTHVQFYPFGIAVKVATEEDLIGKLIAGQLPVNHGMTPFSPEECRNHHSIILLNRTQSDDRRMVYIGRLLALIYAHLNRRRYGGEPRRHLAGDPVGYVWRRLRVQDELWRRWLAGLDTSILMSCAYCLLLAAANNHLGSTWPFIGILFLGGIAATLLFRSISPLLYSYLESIAAGGRPNAPLTVKILTCLLVSNALSYGILLNGTIQDLSSLEHPSSVPRLIVTLLVLATPCLYAHRLNDALAHEHFE